MFSPFRAVRNKGSIKQALCYFNNRPLSGLNLWSEEITSEVKHKIESHWKDKLKPLGFDEGDSTRQKYYVLSMFPYPSGNLHMGHVRVYTISDAIARFQRMNGKNVIHPIGWDAFGLPAENAAIDKQIAPSEWTVKNIESMKAQLETLGCSFEWDRELATCDPQYYKWTQELFIKLFENGLAYQKKAVVNWDPVDQTVLADEQVDENGCSWRSGAKVQSKILKQWFIKTTIFAKDLLEGLDDPNLQDWRDVVKLQRHWIGECNGAVFNFKIPSTDDFLTMWTSQPEHLKLTKFIALSGEHYLSKLEGDELTNGTKRLHVKAENPLSKEAIPIFCTREIEFAPQADSFLGIPGICENSANFAKRFGINFEPVSQILSDEERVGVRKQICEEAKLKNAGGYWTSLKLRDWLVSRQRFWGTPIPIIHCSDCGTVPVPREDLPVKLPNISKLSNKGSSLLNECPDWVNVSCPKCKGMAKRETDTLDTFVDSSWYYLRYLDPKNSKEMFDVRKAAKALPVDLYIGGKEHAVLHLYYARFISYFLNSLGLVPEKEPFKRLLVQGMVMGRSYRLKGTGEYLPEHKVKIVDLKRNKAEVLDTGEPVVVQWEKMSKSKHNGVNPDDMFREYGVDTTRLLVLADVAPTSHRNWNSNTFPGVLNWQKRLWLTVGDFIRFRKDMPSDVSAEKFNECDDYMFDSRNFYLKGATFNYCGSQQHSVAISKQMGLTNSIRKMHPAVFARSHQFERALACQIILLAPMAPSFAAELWAGFLMAPNRLDRSGEIIWDRTICEQSWPEVDQNYSLDLVCQVNGEDIDVVKIPRSSIEQLPDEEAIEMALKQERVKEYLSGRSILNVSYILHPGFEGVVQIKTNWIRRDKKKQERAIK